LGARQRARLLNHREAIQNQGEISRKRTVPAAHPPLSNQVRADARIKIKSSRSDSE
jgi:hypothetical protein